MNEEIKNREIRSDKLISDTSVNIIQDGLDQIVSLWGYPSSGSYRVSKGEITRSTVLNNWLSWLRSYASRMGSTSVISNLTDVKVGDIMVESKIIDIYNGTQNVKNWCNRSECNTSECNSSECNKSECNNGECSYSESNSGEGGGW